jgi:YidC/Oxa1 family membrane protein insertase
MLPLANILQPLIDVFESVLLFFHDNVGLGWGTSIIALTVVVRAALLPLTLKQFKSMQQIGRAHV